MTRTGRQMSGDEFARALAAGLGRAVRDARSVPIEVRRERLYEACIRHRALDPQLSSHRGRWVARVLEASGDIDALAPKILAALEATPDEYEFHHDVAQMSELAVAFARRGIVGAREALYAAHDRQDRDVWRSVRDSIVAHDGLTGFEWIARNLGAQVQSDPESQIDEWFVVQSRDEIGAREFDEWFDRAARVDEHVAAFRAHVQPKIDDWHAQIAKTRNWRTESVETRHKLKFWWNYRFADARQRLLESPREGHYFYWMAEWGKYRADERDREEALAALWTETDPRVLAGMARVFQFRAPLQFDERMLHLLDHDDQQVRCYTYIALQLIEHASVRRVALERLSSDQCDGDTLTLLRANFAAGDFGRIRRVLPQGGEPDETQDIAFELMNLLEVHATYADVDLVEWCYEWGASELRRSLAVDLLMKLDSLSPAIADEARYDSCEYVRASIARGPVPIDVPLPPE